MKKTILFLAFSFVSWLNLFAQNAFTEATLNEFSQQLNANPVQTTQRHTHKSFTFINGKGTRAGYDELVGYYTYYKETVRNLSDLKINQVGQTATVTGKVQHEWQQISKPSEVNKYTGMFTYVYVFDDGIWKIISAQHTDIASDKSKDEVAIKNVIEGETQAYIDGDGKKLLSFWADKKSNEHDSQFLVPIIGKPYATGESMQKLQDLVVPNLKKQDFKVERDNIELRINNNMAWATYTQKASANGTVFKTDRETRILERIDGEWKLVYVGEQAMK